METAFTYATIAYAAIFLSMGIVLLLGHIPHDGRLKVYRSSRRVFAAAYLLLGVTGITDLIFGVSSERNYIIVYIMGAVSLLHAWLNGYAFLLAMDPSANNRRRFKRYGAIGLPLIIAAGGAAVFLPAIYQYASYAMGLVYVGQIVWVVGTCKQEYRTSARALENYYDGTLHFSWINRVLDLTIAIALLNLLNFYIPEVSLALRIATMLFYLYFAIRLLNYVHVFVYVEEARNEEDGIETRNVAASRNTRPAAASGTGNGNGYSEKLTPLIARWIDSKGFSRDSLTIKDVAGEMGTNHTYLSAYLNKQLGVSFQQWLNGLRIEEAKALMKKSPDKTVEEIGRKVGIPESYNFSRWFKQITGVSPQQWRKTELS